MKAEIITIGSEILMGSITNTNSISEKLVSLGVNVMYHTSVQDDFETLESVLKIASSRADLVFLIGGLGPTADDITKEALGKFLGVDLIVDDFQMNKILNYFKETKRNMTSNNIKQAQVLKGSIVFDNLWGTAPGEVIEVNNTKYFLFPGPPREFCPMVDYYLPENIIDSNEFIIKSLNVIALGESYVEDTLLRLDLERENLSINTFAHFANTELKIVCYGSDKEAVQKQVDEVVESLYNSFGKNINGEENISLEEELIRRLRVNSTRIAFAESITGGLLSSTLVKHPNASEVLKASFVVYSNEAKINELGVSSSTIEKYGVVSSETAIEMAVGLHKKGYSDISIGVTGEAGPVPQDKRVGLVYVAYYNGEDISVREYNFSGSRRNIQERTCYGILSHLLLKIGE